jgi:hypothetical protein
VHSRTQRRAYINSTVSNCAEASGGGVYNNGGTVTIVSSTFLDNGLDDFYGAGIWNAEGTVTVTNSTFSGNGGFNILSGAYGKIPSLAGGILLTLPNSKAVKTAVAPGLSKVSERGSLRRRELEEMAIRWEEFPHDEIRLKIYARLTTT